MQPAGGYPPAAYAQMMQQQQAQYAQQQQAYAQYPGQPQQYARPGMPQMMGLPPHMMPQQGQQHAQGGLITPQQQRQMMRPPGMPANPTPQQILFAQQAQQAQMAGGMMGSPQQMGQGIGMGMGMSPQQARMMAGLPKQGGTPVPAANKKRGPKPKVPGQMQPGQPGMHHAQSMPPPQGMLPPHIKPPSAIEEEPLADELDTVTARDLAATRYTRRHELMNEILGPVTIAHLGPPPASYFDVDAEAMEKQVVELESNNERLAKEMERTLRETKERFEAIGKGVAV